MAKGINKVILIGNLGNDPEIKTFDNGGMVANVSIATSESWKDKNTGQQKERTEWHRVIFSNRLAEIVMDYLKKGSKIYVEGKLRTRKWQDQNGQDKYTTEIMGYEMQMLDSKGAVSSLETGNANQANNAPSNAGFVPKLSGSQSPAPSGGFDSFDDDIPF